MNTTVRIRKAFAEDAVAIFESLTLVGPATTPQLSDRLGLSSGTIANHLRRMLAAPLETVVKQMFPRNKHAPFKPALWSVNAKESGSKHAKMVDPLVTALFGEYRPDPLHALPEYAKKKYAAP